MSRQNFEALPGKTGERWQVPSLTGFFVQLIPVFVLSVSVLALNLDVRDLREELRRIKRASLEKQKVLDARLLKLETGESVGWSVLGAGASSQKDEDGEYGD